MNDGFIWKIPNYKKANILEKEKCGNVLTFLEKDHLYWLKFSAKCAFPIPQEHGVSGSKIKSTREDIVDYPEDSFQFISFFTFHKKMKKMCRLPPLIVLNQNSWNCKKNTLYAFLADGWTSLL